MNDSSLLQPILLILSGFYLGVFLCDKAGLKFKIIAYPFVYIFTKLKNLIHKEEKKTNVEKEEN